MSTDEDRYDSAVLAVPDEEAISEVGYQRASPSGSPDGVPNNVRYETADRSEEPWRAILESQNRAMLKLITAMTRQTTGNFSLPEYDPGAPESDARGWSSTAELCLKDNPIVGSALIVALSRAMKGAASKWFSKISFDGMTWPQFKDLFISEYDSSETLAAQLLQLQSSVPKDNESLASYASRMIASLANRWHDSSNEEIAVSTVLARIAQFDGRVRRVAFTAQVSTRDQLLRELKAISYKRSSENQSFDEKRPKLPPSTFVAFKCNHCGRPHRSSECRFRFPPRPSTFYWTPTSSSVKKKIVCFKCSAEGHFANNCPENKKPGEGQIPSSSRRVDLCEVNPVGQLIHEGESFTFTFDSGSECSLMKAEVASKFKGQHFSNVVNMLGIGKSNVQSRLQILSNVTIDGIKFNILFHVLPDQFLRSTIMLGRELLKEGFEVLLNSSECKFTFSPKFEVNLNAVQSMVHEVTFDNITTDLVGQQKFNLISILTRIIADQGRSFAGREFKEFCNSHSIDLHLIATGASRANGQVERVMLTLKNMLTAIEMSEDRSWQDALEEVQLAMNCSINRITKASPLELMMGKVARPLNMVAVEIDDSNGVAENTDVDLTELRERASQNIVKNAAYEKNRFDRGKAKLSKLEVGDFALLKNEERNQTKLDPKYKGPFEVIELLDGDRYLLKALNSNRTYKYAHDRIRKVPKPNSQMEDSDSDSSTEVTKAIAS